MPSLRFVFADESGRQYADTVPSGYTKGVANGVAALDADGDVVDITGTKVTGSGGDIQDALANYIAGYGNVAAGTRLDVITTGGVLPPRPSARTDVRFDVYMAASWGTPDFTGQGYLNMDSWVKMDWVA